MNTKEKNIVTLICLFLFLFFILFFSIQNKINEAKAKENLLKTEILEILEINSKLGEKWRILESEKVELQNKLSEKIKEKEIIENEIQKNRTLIDKKIKTIENPNVENEIEEKNQETLQIEVAVIEEKNRINGFYDIDKLAYAVAMAETGNCTKGIGPKTNNCFGIKNGSIAPCEKVTTSGNKGMCIYDTPEESYEAFKKIWSQGYGVYPDKRLASIWTGNDNPDGWLYIVNTYYNK